MSLCNEFLVNYPHVIVEIHKHGLELRARQNVFFFSSWGEFNVFHCLLWCFVSGWCWKHEVSTLVVTLSNISALCKRSDEMWNERFCSSVRILGTIFAEMFLIHKFFVIIYHTVSLFNITFFTVIHKSWHKLHRQMAVAQSVLFVRRLRWRRSLTSNLWSGCAKVCTLSTFIFILWIFGYPHLGPTCTYSCPSLNFLCHSELFHFFRAYSS
jgi:hypothetical protein